MSELSDNVSRQIAALDGERTPWEGLWQELADVCHPRRGTIQKSQPTTPDRSTLATTFDGTAMRANGTLAAGQAARITPMGARWFVLRPPADQQENPTALDYYARASEILSSKLLTSNFYARAHECYLDRGAFGISALETVAGKDGKGLHFRVIPVGNFSVAQNNLDEVDTISSSSMYTPAQMAQEFGLKNLPDEVRALFDDGSKRYTAKQEVCRLIVPRIDRNPRKEDATNKAIASYHLHKESSTVIRESGFDEIPVAVSRWATWGESPYGWAPAYHALPEASQLNFLEQMLDTLVEVAAFPRVLYPHGMKEEIDFAAMGLTSFDPNQPNAVPREWLTGGNYNIGKDRSNDKRQAIKDAFFEELFKQISNLSADANVPHVQAILENSRELFHPIYSSMVREFLTPVLRRAFAILVRSGEIPPPPREILAEDDLGLFLADPEVEYVSAMALALEQSHLSSVADILNVTRELAMLDPTFLDALNPATLIPHFFRARALPSILLRSDKQLMELQQGRAQQAEEAKAMAASEAVRNLGGAQQTLNAAQQLPQTNEQ